MEKEPCDVRPSSGTASIRADETSRGIERLIELSEQLTWCQLKTLLDGIERNHWKLGKQYGLSVHTVNSLEVLCCEKRTLPRPEIAVFIESKIRLSGVLPAGQSAA